MPADSSASGIPADDAAGFVARQSEDLCRALFERNPLPLLICETRTLHFLAANAAATELYGYPADEFPGRTLADLALPDDLPALRETLGRAGGSSFARTGHWDQRTRDGRVAHVELFVHAVSYEGHDARLLLVHDVTETVRVERALRKAEHHYHTVFDQAPLGVLHFDRALRVVDCNRPLAEALGFSTPDELRGFDLSQLHDQRIFPVFRQALRGERSLYQGPYRATSQPIRVWIAVHVAPLLNGQDEVVGGVAMIEDITARREAEAKLARKARALRQANAVLQQRSRQLEEALGSRNRLYAAMNHELRTPISAIMLFNDLLLGGAIGPLNREQLESVQQAQGAAQHLFELVQDMLDLARLDAGRMTIVREETSVSELLQDLAGTIRPLAEQRGSTLEVHLPSPDCSVTTDARRVRQIVLNLLSNALKFGAGRPITLSCRPVPGSGLEIGVSDRGSGIAAADHERIFEDFVQVVQSEEGSGLGLSISRRLAEALGGSLEVESEPGRGSTFRLRLPASATSPDPSPPTPTSFA